MTDFSAIRILNFYRRNEELPTWSKKFIEKAKHSTIKDVMLGKIAIPESSDVLEEKTEEGKEMMMEIELNKIAFTELVLSIDVSSSRGKIAFWNF
jgi:hypothetical protein